MALILLLLLVVPGAPPGEGFLQTIFIALLICCLSLPAQSSWWPSWRKSKPSSERCRATWANDPIAQLAASDFDQAVQGFLDQYHTSLAEVMSDGPLRSAFFSQSGIKSYLTRPAWQVRWSDDHPLLDGQTETAIYRLAGKLIPFRASHADAQYYTNGTMYSHLPNLAADLRRQNPRIFISEYRDVYKIRHFINKLQRPEVRGLVLSDG